MTNVLDKYMFEFFELLYDSLSELMYYFIADSQALAAIFMLLFFGMESFKMMTGDKKLEIMPLLRPFALGLVLMMWGPFISVITFPTKVITNTARGMFEDQINEVDLLAKERYALIDSMTIRLAETCVDVERAEVEHQSWGEKALGVVGVDLDEIGAKIASMSMYLVGKIKQILFRVIEYIVLMIFRFCVYIVFFLQIVFSCILIVLGPLSFAISIVPVFRDTYVTWLSRFISVSLYTPIAYIILSISMRLLIYGLENEIAALVYLLQPGNEAAFVAYTALSSADITMYIVTLLVGGISMLTIPTISTWMVQTSGVGQAVGAVMSSSSKIGSQGASLMKN